jgi:hypothetical protein
MGFNSVNLLPHIAALTESACLACPCQLASHVSQTANPVCLPVQHIMCCSLLPSLNISMLSVADLLCFFAVVLVAGPET